MPNRSPAETNLEEINLEEIKKTGSHSFLRSKFFTEKVIEYNSEQDAYEKMLLLSTILNHIFNIYGDGNDIFYPLRFGALLYFITSLQNYVNKILYKKQAYLQNIIDAGDDSDATKAELYAHQFRLGSILSLSNNYNKLEIRESQKCGRTVIAREKIPAGEDVTIMDPSTILCSNNLLPVSIRPDQLTETSNPPCYLSIKLI